MLPTSLLLALCVLLAGASAAPLDGPENALQKRVAASGRAQIVKVMPTTSKRPVIAAPAPTERAKTEKAAVPQTTKVPASPKESRILVQLKTTKEAGVKATKALNVKATKALSSKATKALSAKATKAQSARATKKAAAKATKVVKATKTRRAPAKAPLQTKAREDPVVRTTKARIIKTTRVPPPPPPPPNWQFDGRATWYSPCDPAQNHGWSCMGSCSNTVRDYDAVVAMNFAQYNGCGACVEILDVERGNVARFQVADRCAGCGWGQLDLTPGALNQLGRNTGNWGDAEFPIRWRYC